MAMQAAGRAGSSAPNDVPTYLVRLLDDRGETAGTGFTVAPGWLVTAWHVVDRLGAPHPGGAVALAPLQGRAAAPVVGIVERVRAGHDLAVVRFDGDLGPGGPAPLAAADAGGMAGVRVVVLGAAPGGGHRIVTGRLAPGGPDLWELPGRGAAPGLAGAPVRRARDGRVVGVVTGRAGDGDDGPVRVVGAGAVTALVGRLVPAGGPDASPVATPAPLELTLSVAERLVILRSAEGDQVASPCSGVMLGGPWAVDDLRRARARHRGHPSSDPAALDLTPVGVRLAEAFLPAGIGRILGDKLAGSAAGGRPVRLGVAPAVGLARMPWETMPEPVSGLPLALVPGTSVYRTVAGPLSGSPTPGPGPLRVLAGVAAPDAGAGPGFDREAEVAAVTATTGAARAAGARVRVVEKASAAAVRAALAETPADVLHLRVPGSPGSVLLEDGTGRPLATTADELLDEAVPAGRLPPVVVLAVQPGDGSAAAGEPVFAARLVARGAAAVVSVDTALGDAFAIALLSRVYRDLAAGPAADVVTAVTDARRALQPDHADWSAVTVTVAAGDGSGTGTGSTRRRRPAP